MCIFFFIFDFIFCSSTPGIFKNDIHQIEKSIGKNEIQTFVLDMNVMLYNDFSSVHNGHSMGFFITNNVAWQIEKIKLHAPFFRIFLFQSILYLFARITYPSFECVCIVKIKLNWIRRKKKSSNDADYVASIVLLVYLAFIQRAHKSKIPRFGSFEST